MKNIKIITEYTQVIKIIFIVIAFVIILPSITLANGTTITVLGDNPISVNQNSSYVEPIPAYSAFDNMDGNITTAVQTSGMPVDTSTDGTKYIAYSVQASDGQWAYATRTVVVVAASGPVITILGSNPVSINQGDTYTDAGATAVSEIGVDITGSIITTGLPVNTSAAGAHSVVYSVTSSGVTSNMTRTVNVIVVPQPPVLTMNGASSITVNYAETYTDGGATAYDNMDGNITSNITTSGLPINTNMAGTYQIVYSVTNSNGLTSSSTRIVNVNGALSRRNRNQVETNPQATPDASTVATTTSTSTDQVSTTTIATSTVATTTSTLTDQVASTTIAISTDQVTTTTPAVVQKVKVATTVSTSIPVTATADIIPSVDVSSVELATALAPTPAPTEQVSVTPVSTSTIQEVTASSGPIASRNIGLFATTLNIISNSIVTFVQTSLLSFVNFFNRFFGF